MKKKHILLLFIMLSVGLHAQKTATGYILDKDSRAALEGVEVRVEGEMIMAVSNKYGEFAVEVQKGSRHLLFNMEKYTPIRYTLRPGFQRGKIRVYMESYKPVNPYSKKRLENDSLFPTFKNAVSISIIEFFAVGIGLRYERFLVKKHAVGLHATYYIRGMSSSMYFNMGYSIVSTYTGFKMAPFYRFYLARKKTMGFFLDAKVPFGYFYFDDLEYRYSRGISSFLSMSITRSFWTWGGGLSVGFMARLGKSKHGLINFSLGYQYFPMAEVPKSIDKVYPNVTLTHETDINWWKETGPGASFEVKLTIGGIF